MEIDKNLPFETLLALEQKLGSKTFREAHVANKKESQKLLKKKNMISQKHQDSDEAPEEVSSKHLRKKFVKSSTHKETLTIDPRFSTRTGKFRENHFRRNYQFAFDLKDKELELLKKSTPSNQDPIETGKENYLIQRMENQNRELQKKKNQKSKFIVNKDGSKYFPSKKEMLAKELVEKFKVLKDTGKLKGHLEKRRKKQAGKERKRMQIEKT